MFLQVITLFYFLVLICVCNRLKSEYASFRIQKWIFSRIGSDSPTEANASSFMMEMREAAYILQHCSDDSLVIIDELGRGVFHSVNSKTRRGFILNTGSSFSDGFGLCLAILEELARSKAFVFVATHFRELYGSLSKEFTNIIGLHLEVSAFYVCIYFPN
jgi:DNA mismatch repair protein MSH4